MRKNVERQKTKTRIDSTHVDKYEKAGKTSDIYKASKRENKSKIAMKNN
jgi:hypothetical protein